MAEQRARYEDDSRSVEIADADLDQYSPEAIRVLREDGQEAWQRWVIEHEQAQRK